MTLPDLIGGDATRAGHAVIAVLLGLRVRAKCMPDRRICFDHWNAEHADGPRWQMCRHYDSDVGASLTLIEAMAWRRETVTVVRIPSAALAPAWLAMVEREDGTRETASGLSLPLAVLGVYRKAVGEARVTQATQLVNALVAQLVLCGGTQRTAEAPTPAAAS